MKLSIVIPTFNEEKYIETTLKRLTDQTLSRNNYEIIVVDNGSQDRTVSIVKKYADKVIVLDKKRTIGSLRNMGVAHSRGSLILFMDADVLVDSDFLDKVVSFKGDYGLPKVKIGSIRLINLVNNIFHTISGGLNITLGCCMLFRKELFLSIDGFDEGLVCNEDLDIFLKAKDNGHIFELIDSVVIHNDRRFRKQGYFKSLIYSIRKLAGYILFKRNGDEYSIVR